MKVEAYVDDAGEHRWRAVHANGQIMAGPQEGYVNKRDMTQALMTLHNELPSAIAQHIGDPTPSQIDRLRRVMDDWEKAVMDNQPEELRVVLKGEIVTMMLNFLR